MDVNACTYTGQQFIFIREAPTQKGIVVTNAANESIDPWPEVKIPPTLAPEGAVFKDVMDPLAKEFVVTNGMLYVQVRLPYPRPKHIMSGSKERAALARIGTASISDATRLDPLSLDTRTPTPFRLS